MTRMIPIRSAPRRLRSAGRRPRLVQALATALASVLLLTGCGLGTAGGYSPTGRLTGDVAGVDLSGVSLDVGSKNFTEQIILGKIAVILMQSAGADVQDLTNVPGSNSVRQAMLQGQMDFQWEYTGTAWITYMGNDDPIIDAREQYEAVHDADAENGLAWLEPAELNNTYGFAVPRKTAEEYGITRLSQIDELPPSEQTYCIDAEFAARNDGFEPLLSHYELDEAPEDRRRVMDLGAIYQATADGACTFGEVFTTDGRIPALDLVVLEDDEQYFPKYNVAPVLAEEVLDEHPQLTDLLTPLTERLDNETMSRLNARVDVDGEEPAAVAWDYLREEGLVADE